MIVIDLGTKDYKEVWDIQKTLHKKRVDTCKDDILILVEHEHVFTLGKSGKKDNLLIPQNVLKEKDIAYYEIERGGDITYHGPGQLVGYPIMNIKQGLAGIRPFIEHLEQVIIQALKAFHIKGMKREKMIGVWTDAGKICSIGVAVQRWVSLHGFALNVNTDLSYFNLINPCGLPNLGMTSMQQMLGKHIEMPVVKQHIIESYAAVFRIQLVQKCLEEII